ncbi:Tyrosinase [Penicillium expansum]|uniref:Tyrosinase n=1 Tax=Penicillium expansum TaxID=27334 RepID=A0A0A2JVP7_PENEN|nr:Tyrosinase [Penicillium expansum]KGO55074.1 Tyrosinase [Penicillium expansum]KGO56270.1 Tyrosinase [Penicillium expansum]
MFMKEILSFALAISSALATAVVPCREPALRKEWRQLSVQERNGYVKAVQCLATTPSRLGLNTTLYDDFAYVHNKLNSRIHFVASFLPWHRYYVHVYEEALKQCGYEGSMAYWDWTLDARDPAHSTIWDAKVGVGGNGDPKYTNPVGKDEYECVSDGPFRNLRPAYLQDDRIPHCLSRNFNNGTEYIGNMLASEYTPNVINKISKLRDYNSYRISLESGPHGAVHSAIGGDMSPATSPNDPIFFLHHTQIDRLWWLWQQEMPSNRTYDYSGIRTQDNFDGKTPPAATLNDLLPMLGMAKDLPVKQVMKTQTSLLCYRY